MSIYFDNSATTSLDPEVFEAMRPYFLEHFGNPSSTHAVGRAAKSAVEMSRKTIAGILNASPSEIYFTSGGTEADNTAIQGFVHAFGLKHVISTPVEHHAVLHTMAELGKRGIVNVHFLDLDEKGVINYDQLETFVREYPDSLVSLMHANNEIGNLLDIQKAGEICREYGAYFHSDTVQSIGRYAFDLKSTPVQAIIGSAHKFHGPKGTGFLYINSKNKIGPFLFGGGQERGLRSGTENVAGIVGMSKAMEIAYNNMGSNREIITALKERLVNKLKNNFPGIIFNGMSEDSENSLYSLVSIGLPKSDKNDLILFQMDINGIAVSGGSACESGALQGSHVINEISRGREQTTIRFSFSKFNNESEVDFAINKLVEILD